MGSAYDIRTLPKILEDLGYSLDGELRRLWELTQHPDPKVALLAQGRWRATLKDIRLANAVLLTMTTKEDGTQERSATAVAMLETLAQENANARKRTQNLHEHHPATGGEGTKKPTQVEAPRLPQEPDVPSEDDLFDPGRLADVFQRRTDPGAAARLTPTGDAERPDLEADAGGGEGTTEAI